jgi:hypothetical protein
MDTGGLTTGFLNQQGQRGKTNGKFRHPDGFP